MGARDRSGGLSYLAPVAIAIVFLISAGASVAQNRDPYRPLTLHDANGDGRISREEWPRRNFGRIDQDADGFLTPEDFAEFWGVALPEPDAAARASGQAANGRKSGQRQHGAQATGAVQWIDTHVHATGGSRNSPADFRETIGQARDAIGENGFARALLMPTPQLHPTRNGYFTLEGFISEARKSPGQFAFLGGGGTLNPMINDESPDGKVDEALRRRFENRAEEILSLGAVGFGEMTALHFSLTEHHPFESVSADHPLFLLLADIAARHDVPIDLHMEPVARDIPTPDYLLGRDNPAIVKRNIDGLERLLMHNRKAKIVWAHAGTALLPHRTVELTEQLMERHPNLYLQIGVRPGRVRELQILGPGGVKKEWAPLLQKYSDRIVLGGDQFFSPPNNMGPAAKFAGAAGMVRRRFALLLASLPSELARKIGYENAVRIYRLAR